MASTPPAPFERCAPGSADHRCARRGPDRGWQLPDWRRVLDLCRWCLSSDRVTSRFSARRAAPIAVAWRWALARSPRLATAGAGDSGALVVIRSGRVQCAATLVFSQTLRPESTRA